MVAQISKFTALQIPGILLKNSATKFLV